MEVSLDGGFGPYPFVLDLATKEEERVWRHYRTVIQVYLKIET